ncbi:MAG: serine/threonine-protein kinase [Cyanobacteria bacterium J06554_6]
MTHSLSHPQTTHLLNGRYTLKETLGVRLGRRTLLGYDHAQQTPVIIKYLCEDDPLQPSDRDRFEREVSLLRRLDHPAIPAFTDYFEVSTATHRGQMLVQRFVEGHSLFSQIQLGRTFNEAELKQIAEQVLTILEYLHQHHPAIIHRDIKPSNLVLSPSSGAQLGQIHLVDFGLAQTTVDPNQMVIAGTDGYRPPEQLGDQATAPSDLYALGMTLIHLATGKHPSELPHRGLKVLFAQELGHFSRPFKHWLRWLTEPRQEKRPQSANEACQVLQNVEKVFSRRLSPTALGHAITQKVKHQRQLFEAFKPQGTQVQLEAGTETLEVIIPAARFQGLDRGLWATIRSSTLGLIGLAAAAAGLVVVAEMATAALAMPYGWSIVAIATLFGLLLAVANTLAAWRGLSSLMSRCQRRVHVQLAPDILLVGYTSPLQSMQYVVNARRQDIFDIDLRPDKSQIHVFLMRNRTRSGQLNYTLTAKELGLKPSEMLWLNDLLHIWLKRTSPIV